MKSLRKALERRAVRLSHAEPAFRRTADHSVLSLRRAMGVPDQAEPEVEDEFAALRDTLDEKFRHEFDKIYWGLLVQHLGSAASVVLHALEGAPVQAYLAVADRIGSDVEAALRELVPAVRAVLSGVVAAREA